MSESHLRLHRRLGLSQRKLQFQIGLHRMRDTRLIIVE